MSDTPSQPPAATDPTAAPPPPGYGPLTLNIQYIKDLSFEVPGAPEIFTTLREQPRVDLQLDVQARSLDAPRAGRAASTRWRW
jgi:preprotein translocase subunit SecB